MKLGIIGLGLMGGSFALDFKSIYPKSKIFGLDKSKKNENRALELGLIDELITLEQLSKVDVILVAIPVDKSLEELPKILNSVNKDTLVFDVGSTKLPICEVLLNHPNRKNFLATHPMAGTEFSGPNAAVEGLYFNKNNIVCDIEKTNPKIYKKALRIFKMLNMNIIKMDSKSHDVHVAYVSHLSHISSFMLGKTVIDKEKNERDIFDMAGSGFESTVRLAKSSPAMWTPIFEQNKDNIVETLDEYIGNLKQFKKLMEEHKFDQVFDEMQETNHIATILKGIK